MAETDRGRNEQEMNRDMAEGIAIAALEWLGGQPDLLAVFMGASGLDAAMLPEVADEPGFLGGVLDFLLLDDAHVLAFCAACDLPNDAPMQARMALPGGDLPNWT